jgi:hypothetical protein
VLPVAQLAWMAGIVDLKGRIIRKNNKTRTTQQLVLFVESKHIQVIRGLGRMTGLRAEMQTPPQRTDWFRRNCNEHCDNAHVHVAASEWPAIGRWTITGAAMATVLHGIAPYMLVDRGWDEVMLEIYDQATLKGQGSGMTLSALRRLRDLGWDIPPELKWDEGDGVD